MNESLQPPPVADDDIGPLDENGEQIWSPEEEAAIARLQRQPGYWESLEEADAQIDRGEGLTSEEAHASMIEMKRRWFAEKGITPPPGYFDS